MNKILGRSFSISVMLLVQCVAMPLYAASGTEGAAFLNIPVGGGPAAMGAAYTALANDAYAATYNPAGLGALTSNQFSGQHLSYLDSLHYEYFSFALQLPGTKADPSDEHHSALGGSVQYLGSGDIDSTNDTGAAIGTFSSYYAAYNLSYGHSIGDKLSLGLTSKLISAKIGDAKASAYAADLGSMYKVNPDFTLAATVINIGSKLTFIDQGDSLPLEFHLGGAYHPGANWLITAEGVYPKTGLASFHVGGEWHPIELLAIRAGYRTDTVRELSNLAGVSAGLGLDVWGQELSYAYLPYGDLGTTHYISLLMKFGEAEKAKRNLIQYQHIKTHRTAMEIENGGTTTAPDYQQLLELLTDTEAHVAQGTSGVGANP